MTDFLGRLFKRLDYDALNRMAKTLDRPVSTLIVQDAGADPFYGGMESRRERAEWFAGIWEGYGIQAGAHLRRIHYLLVSQSSPVELPREVNGSKMYVNTYNCWQFLGDAATDARYLGLVPVGHIVDARNAETVVNYDASECDASVGVVDVNDGTLPMPHVSFAAFVPAFPKLPSLQIEAPLVAQPYCIELWIEKSTMDDVLAPLCRQHGVNLTSGGGDISLTRANDLIERARSHGKPTRVLTITDFDPGGSNMPVGLARKLEFLSRDAGLDLDIQVRPIALTREQVRRYRLPRVPIKESNKQAAEFERRHNVAGATELDALEALRPGELRKIVEEEIARYIDPDLDDNVAKAHQDAQSELVDITKQAHAEHKAEIEALRKEHRALTKAIREQIAPFQTQFEEIERRFEQRFRARFESLNERMKALLQGLTTSLNDMAPGPGDIYWPEPEFADEDDDPLFDSTRDYVEQIDRFKEHQQKPTERRPRNGGGRQ
jgi:hypothetical protein